MKEQNELLAEKSKEIALMKEKLKNFSRQPLQKSSIEKSYNGRCFFFEKKSYNGRHNRNIQRNHTGTQTIR